MRELRFRIRNKKSGYTWITTMEEFLTEDGYYCHNSDYDEFIVMQYTGLKDKNGKEIYEKDIIIPRDISGSGRVREFNPRVVEWGEYSCGYNISNYGGETTYEKIGNIYENPELLKEQECK